MSSLTHPLTLTSRPAYIVNGGKPYSVAQVTDGHEPTLTPECFEYTQTVVSESICLFSEGKTASICMQLTFHYLGLPKDDLTWILTLLLSLLFYLGRRMRFGDWRGLAGTGPVVSDDLIPFRRTLPHARKY